MPTPVRKPRIDASSAADGPRAFRCLSQGFLDNGDALLVDMLHPVLITADPESRRVWEAFIKANPLITAGTACSGTDSPIIAMAA
eukprot:6717988-Pyramimonas_sp.AAC.1